MTTTPFVTRAQAGLRPPKRPLPTNITPVHLTGHYGGSSPWPPGTILGPGAHDRCASIWRAWQAYHQDAQGWVDIGYTSGACPHGYRYEGRGPGHRTAAQGTNDGNQRSYATVYIAGAGDPLTDFAKVAMLDEAERLGVPLNRGHRDWFATSCPGDLVQQWIDAGAPRPGALPPPPVNPPPPVLPPADVLEALRKLAPFAQAAREKPVVRLGDQGEYVVQVQQALNRIIGRDAVGVDGRFGPQTETFVRWLQGVTGLAADGIVGEQTWLQLILRSWGK